MAEWAKGEGEAQRQKELMDLARDKARGGAEAFKKWWATDEGKAARQTLRPIMDEIQQIAADADRAADQSDEDPFGEGPADEQRGEAFNDAEAEAMAQRAREETNAMAAAA